MVLYPYNAISLNPQKPFLTRKIAIMKKETSKTLQLTKIKIASLSTSQQGNQLRTDDGCWSNRQTCASCVLTCTTNLC